MLKKSCMLYTLIYLKSPFFMWLWYIVCTIISLAPTYTRAPFSPTPASPVINLSCTNNQIINLGQESVSSGRSTRRRSIEVSRDFVPKYIESKLSTFSCSNLAVRHRGFSYRNSRINATGILCALAGKISKCTNCFRASIRVKLEFNYVLSTKYFK